MFSEPEYYTQRSGHFDVDKLDMTTEELRRLGTASGNLRIVGLSPYALYSLHSRDRETPRAGLFDHSIR